MHYPATPSSHQGHATPRTPPSQTGRHHHNGQLPTPGAPHMYTTALPGAPASGYMCLPPTPYIPTVPLPLQHSGTGLLTPPDSPIGGSRDQPLLKEHLSSPRFVYDMQNDVHKSGLSAVDLSAHATYPAVGQLVVIVQAADLGNLSVVVGDGRSSVTVRDVLHRLYKELNRPLANGATFWQLYNTRRYIFAGLIPLGGNNFGLQLRA